MKVIGQGEDIWEQKKSTVHIPQCKNACQENSTSPQIDIANNFVSITVKFVCSMLSLAMAD